MGLSILGSHVHIRDPPSENPRYGQLISAELAWYTLQYYTVAWVDTWLTKGLTSVAMHGLVSAGNCKVLSQLKVYQFLMLRSTYYSPA